MARFTQHDSVVPFDRYQIGIDHAALAVDTEEGSQEWAASLIQLGVALSGILKSVFSSVLSFRGFCRYSARLVPHQRLSPVSKMLHIPGFSGEFGQAHTRFVS